MKTGVLPSLSTSPQYVGVVINRAVSREDHRKQWLKEAFEGHAQSSVEKVWSDLDDEPFVD